MFRRKAAATPTYPKYSKDWWNQQLGRPYVLYPLCALIILLALFFSFGNPFASKVAPPVAKQETAPQPPAVPQTIPVTFKVQRHAVYDVVPQSGSARTFHQIRRAVQGLRCDGGNDEVHTVRFVARFVDGNDPSGR